MFEKAATIGIEYFLHPTRPAHVKTIKNVIIISRMLSVSIGVSNSVDFIDFKYHKLQTAGSFLYGGEANANHMN